MASLEAALAAYRSIDGLKVDSDAAAGFGIASARLLVVLSNLGRPVDSERAGAEGLGVTEALLEREPSNMLALRARGVILSYQADAAFAAMQPARRLSAADAGARDWALLSRFDPVNMISKRNLVHDRWIAAAALWELGRMREALLRLLDLSEFEPVAATSNEVAHMLSVSFYSGAMLAAELGKAATAERLLADYVRHDETVVRGLPQTSFDVAFRRARRVAPIELANLQGDPASARAAAKGVRERLLGLQPKEAIDYEQVAGALRRLHLALGWAELQARDYAAALGHFSHVAEARKRLPTRTPRQRLDATDDSALLAITLARSGRVDEARSLAEPALAWHRDNKDRLTDYPPRHRSLVLALLAAAHTTPAKTGALLAEAQAELDRLPPELRAARSNRMLQGLIADARRAKR